MLDTGLLHGLEFFGKGKDFLDLCDGKVMDG